MPRGTVGFSSEEEMRQASQRGKPPLACSGGFRESGKRFGLSTMLQVIVPAICAIILHVSQAGAGAITCRLSGGQ